VPTHTVGENPRDRWTHTHTHTHTTGENPSDRRICLHYSNPAPRQRVCRDSHRGPSTPRLLSYSGMSVAVCALQCTAVCSVLQCVTVCCSALQCVAACGKRRTVTLKQAFNSSSFDLLWYSIFVDCATLHHTAIFGPRYLCCSMYVAVCCRTCVAVCCSVLQVCCSVWIGVCRDSQTGSLLHVVRALQ